MSTPRPNMIIKPAQGSRQIVYADGDTGDIIRVIMYADAQSAPYVYAGSAERLRGRNDLATLQNVYWFVRSNVGYQVDTPGFENVRSPGSLFERGLGDCKSMSVSIAALCRHLGIPFRYRFVKQANRPNFHHVYVIARTRDGKTVVLDATHPRFNAEYAYRQKLDLSPGQRVPSNISGSDTPANAYWVIGSPGFAVMGLNHKRA